MGAVLFEEEEMKLRNEDKVWLVGIVHDEVRAAVQDYLAPRGWKKFTRWLREWGLVAVIPTMMLGLLTLVFAAGYYAFSRVRQEAEFEATTKQRLDSIEKTLTGLRAVEDLKAITKLDQQTFAKSLPALRKIMQQPASEVKPPQETIREIADKLRSTNPESEAYWPTVLQFLNFASAGLSADVPPPRTPNIFIARNIGNFSAGLVRRQVVLLDGGELVDSRFENSRIIFTNNAVRFRNVTFVNCVFQIPVVNSPNDYLKKASQVLLASDLKSASFTSL